MDVYSEKDLVQRGCIFSRETGHVVLDGITGLHESRIAALIVGSLDGSYPEKIQLLSCGHVGPVHLNCLSSTSASEQHTLLDLAVMLGCRDLALLLAEHGSTLSIDLVRNHVYYWKDYPLDGAFDALMRVLATGRFREHMALILRENSRLGQFVVHSAILSGNAEVVSELKAMGACGMPPLSLLRGLYDE